MLIQGSDIELIGGLTSAGASTAAILLLNPSTGRARAWGQLSAATHDAAGAVLAGRGYLFGGDDTGSAATVQRLRRNDVALMSGSLPRSRSDLVAVTVGGAAFLIGGYDGTALASSVLKTTNGTTFTTVASMPVPVRYPAIAVLGDVIWVFGGQNASGSTDVIQRIDVRTGHSRIVGRLPSALSGASAVLLHGQVYLCGGTTPAGISDAIRRFDPISGRTRVVGRLPTPLSNAAAAVLDNTGYLLGGETNSDHDVRGRPTAVDTTGRACTMIGRYRGIGAGGRHRVPALATVAVLGLAILSVITLTQPTDHGTPAPPRSGVKSSAHTPGTGDSHSAAAIPAASQPWLSPVGRQVVGHLRPGSNPNVLPSSLLIVDKFNNRLIVVDPQGRIRWQFPQAGDLAPGQRFLIPDDAFFTPDGRYIIATQEDQAVISLIDIATHRILYRYGVPAHPGMAANHLSNPDDAIVLPDGYILSADIKNCRLVLIAPGAHTPTHIIGRTTTACLHDPPRRWGSPNGIFPMRDGHYLITEINGDWVDSIGLDGTIYWTTHPPGVTYPSDSNQIGPDRFLTVDYASPGQVVIFDHTGRKIWSYRGTGSNTLNHPSLALPLPNGDIILNDDFNHRVIVIDPHTNAIIWQYGTTGVAGSRPGYLNNPDGIDLVPPQSLLITHSATMGLLPAAPTK